MNDEVLTVDVYKLPRLRALRQRLRTLMQRGDIEQASKCSDLILELSGLRPCRLEDLT